jgi:hypothetical protein
LGFFFPKIRALGLILLIAQATYADDSDLLGESTLVPMSAESDSLDEGVNSYVGVPNALEEGANFSEASEGGIHRGGGAFEEPTSLDDSNFTSRNDTKKKGGIFNFEMAGVVFKAWKDAQKPPEPVKAAPPVAVEDVIPDAPATGLLTDEELRKEQGRLNRIEQERREALPETYQKILSAIDGNVPTNQSLAEQDAQERINLTSKAARLKRR